MSRQDETVDLTDVQQQQLVGRFNAPGHVVHSAAASAAADLLALGRNVLVYRLRVGARQWLRGHTDEVSLLRFVCGGRMLITADENARVRLWPRRGEKLLDHG